MKRLGITLALLVVCATVGADQESRTFWLHEWVHPVVAEAGLPKECDMDEEPPCAMDSCRKMAKGQMYCAPKKCTKKCCSCIAECNGHQLDPPPDPEGSPE